MAKKRKLKHYQVGLKSEAFAVSLVSHPAIESDFIHMSENEEPVDIKLSSDERHMLYGAVLIPDKPIYRNNGKEEYYISFSKESIERLSHEYMRNMRISNVTLQHEEDANDVFMVESWIKESNTLDKSISLGLSADLPVGTWIAAYKVNDEKTWERVKSGELKGFSIEAMVALDEFSKQEEEEPMTKFWSKMKDLLIEVFGAVQLIDKEEETNIEEVDMKIEEKLEEQAPVVENTPVEPEPAPAEPQPAPAEPAVEPAPEPVKEPEPEPTKEPLDDLIKSLQAEISALKESNSKLENRVKDLGRKPSAKPVNVQSTTGVGGDAYANWREQMRKFM